MPVGGPEPGPTVTEVPFAGDERPTVLGALQRQRDLVLWKVDGLSDHDAHRVGTTTGLTIHGILDHLTDVERSLVRRWFAGRRGLHIGGIDAEHVQAPLEVPGARLKELIAAYVEESRRCDDIIAEHDLADLEVNGDRTLRWIMHHLIEETSRHVGHLDLLRELADGTTGEAPGRP